MYHRYPESGEYEERILRAFNRSLGHISDKTARCQEYRPGPVTDANCLRFTRQSEELFALVKGVA